MDLKCEYCKKFSHILQICPHCEKVWYCNESHRNRHQPHHESECFPAIIHSEEDCGRYWVASKDVQKGELIFTETALVIGPSPECSSVSPLLYPTCLGCCRRTNTVYKCSKCHWPVCSKQCEKVPQHADFECKVFRKNKVHSSARPQYYLYIQFLRALLLSNQKPTLFQKMMELEPHIECRRDHKEESQISKSFYRFVTEDCNLKYDFDYVDHVVGVNRINSYAADIVNSNSKKRACTALFCQMSLINHNCLPNTRTVIYENPDLSLNMGLFASVDIYKGQCITQQYYPVVKGTAVRKKALKEWFFNCNCKRCADPTEFGTYFSCLTCRKCQVGFVCPVNPQDDFCDWKCNRLKCDYTQSHDKIQSQVNEMEQEIQKNEESVESLEKVLEYILDKDVHIHHYLSINVQYDITQRIVKALNNNRDIDLIRRGVRYCRNIFKVVDVICPGYSYYRGVILYFLGNCLFALHKMNELRRDDCDMEELKGIIQEGIDIMEVEPEGSVYREMAEELETYQRSLFESCS